MRLAEARRRMGYSARGFAKATGSSTRTIYELEKGRRLARPSTINKLAEVLLVAADDVDEFQQAIREEMLRSVPPEVLIYADEMGMAGVNLVDASFMRVAAQRSLKEVMEYLIRSGHPEDVERIYRKVQGKDARQKKGQAKGKPSSSVTDAGPEGTKLYAE